MYILIRVSDISCRLTSQIKTLEAQIDQLKKDQSVTKAVEKPTEKPQAAKRKKYVLKYVTLVSFAFFSTMYSCG